MAISDDLRAVAKFGTPMLNGRSREDFLNAAADEIDRLRSLVKFHEEQKRQSEAVKEAAMRLVYPGLFPELSETSESGERSE